MNQVQIQFPKPWGFMSKSFSCPIKWNQLNSKQLMAIAPDVLAMYMQLAKGHEDVAKSIADELEIKAVAPLLGAKLWWALTFINTQQFEALRKLSAFILEDKLSLTDTVVRKFKHKGKWYYGPGDSFSNTSISEFAHADIQFMKFKGINEQHYMDLLVAILYRPAQQNYDPNSPISTGDIRERFNSHNYEHRAKSFASLDQATKAAIVLQFWGCRDYLVEKHPAVWSNKKEKAKSAAWGGFLVDMAGDKFGTLEHTEQVNVWHIFGYCNQAMLDQKKREKKLKEDQKKLKLKNK